LFNLTAHGFIVIVELALPSGTIVRFPADACPELLVAVLRGLEERPC
jgi:transposase